jgi:hypothetical protein
MALWRCQDRNVILLHAEQSLFQRLAMTPSAHDHTGYPHHHHRPGEGHPAAAVAPSILRMGALERLSIAAVLIAVIWALAFWAIA